MFSLEASFINAEGVRGIKVCKKIPFFDVKIVRCLSGVNCKKLRYFQKLFSNDDLGTQKKFFDSFGQKSCKLTLVSEYHFRFSTG